jgi:hypothetical protein
LAISELSCWRRVVLTVLPVFGLIFDETTSDAPVVDGSSA